MEESLLALDRQLGQLVSRGDRDWRKTLDAVFDEPTLRAIQQLFSRGVLHTLENIIATGKEANVFRGKTLDGRNRAVKIYRINTATFRKLAPYLDGDPRFPHGGKSHRDRIFTWAQKEFKNLHLMHAAGASVPQPFHVHRNLLVMQYRGWRYRPYPTLRELPPEEPREFLQQLMDSVKAYHAAGLAHGDLSEYNVLNVREQPCIIDVGQAVPRQHPRFAELHERDLGNVHRWFRKRMPGLTREEVEQWST